MIRTHHPHTHHTIETRWMFKFLAFNRFECRSSEKNEKKYKARELNAILVGTTSFAPQERSTQDMV